MITICVQKLLRIIATLTFGLGFSNADAQTRDREHFVLVHGGWQGAWAWYRIETKLEAMGHAVTALDLPGHGIDRTDPATVSLADYVDRVVQVIDQSERPVILVGHSAGGLVLSSAAEARPEAIDKLVYVAAFLLQSGQTLLEVSGSDAGSLVNAALRPDPSGLTIDIDRTDVRAIFYGSSRNRDVTLARRLLRTSPSLPFVTPLFLTDERFGAVRRFYVRTLNDRAISPSVQDAMLSATPVEAVFDLNTDHSPFFSRPLLLAAILLDIAHR